MNFIKVKIEYEKDEYLKYLSHLDILRMFYRATRRAQLPIVYTSGFSPHPKITFSKAEKVGSAQRNGFICIYLKEHISPIFISDLFKRVLPEGITIKNVEFI